jgi:hypothetical protein
MKILLKLFALPFMLFGQLFSQSAPFQISLQTFSINGLGGIQSYAWGQHNGKWLIVGGRLDGLHRRQPFAAFDLAGHNTQLIVVDPATQQKWSAPLTSLPQGMQEQFSSTNMEFHQKDDYLYLLGGYGYSSTSLDHITFPNLSAIKVSDVISAIINNTAFAGHCRQITDTMFAVTGGVLNAINTTYYLTGGQKFMGRYNPQGPTHGPGFVQHYTNAIRKFKIYDNGVNLSVTHLPSFVDAVNLHRRDYNVVPQIIPTGEEGITAFSGVFQATVNLPYLNCVNIDSAGYSVNNAFAQYYNHYHCARIPLYSAAANEMHTVFFGGIAQYYDNAGTLMQDNNVPFVKTIARVTRDANGTMSEYKLPIEMPSLLGAGSEFIPLENVPQFNNEVFKLDDFAADTTLVGYIYGGISSSAANVFFSNSGTPSIASAQMFKVYIIKNTSVGVHELNQQSSGTLHLQVSPNPNDGDFVIKFNLVKAEPIDLSIFNTKGELLEKIHMDTPSLGENTLYKKVKQSDDGGVYVITLETSYEKATQKIVIEH